jgi:exopolysaccharide production protein ExoZ
MLVYIQILRLFAATAVVTFHAWGVAPQFIKVAENAPSYGLKYAGHGVDLFFVISGFIIFYATHRADLTPAAFLRRRVERIVPLYFFMIFAVVALALAFPVTFDTPDWYTPRHILKSLAFISFTDGAMPVVYVGWSLEYEMYFYLCVAVLMALTRDVWRNIVVMFSALTIVGQIPGVTGALGNHTFFVDALILEFVFGVMVGQWFVHRRIDLTALAAIAGAIAMLLAFDPANRALVFGLPSALLVAGGAYVSRLRPKPSPPEYALERLGDASYSIYLAQVNTVSLACGYVVAIVPEISRAGLITAATLAVLLAGLLLNILVERPLLRLCRSIGPQRTRDARPA